MRVLERKIFHLVIYSPSDCHTQGAPAKVRRSKFNPGRPSERQGPKHLSCGLSLRMRISRKLDHEAAPTLTSTRIQERNVPSLTAILEAHPSVSIVTWVPSPTCCACLCAYSQEENLILRICKASILVISSDIKTYAWRHLCFFGWELDAMPFQMLLTRVFSLLPVFPFLNDW